MGVFSQMNLEMQERISTTQSGMFSKAEELDDARQEAEAEAAKATLAKLTEDSSPSDEAPSEEAPPEEDNEEQKRKEDPKGVWLAMGKPDADGFHLIGNQPVWQASTSTRHGTSGDFSQWTDFSFGEPHVLVMEDGKLLVCFWYEQDGTRGIRYVQLCRE